jgi:16S rRNA processing protein RimM
VELVVGRIARAHGVTGEVAVDVRTDSPDLRFAVGAALETDPRERGPLTVRRTRWHSGRLLVRFDEIPDRTVAETFRGTLLVADSSTSPATDDPDEFWDHQLVGLAVLTLNGRPIGEVAEVLHATAGDTLAVRTPEDEELLVPFVKAIVPVVDVAQGRVFVDPPEGLLDL